MQIRAAIYALFPHKSQAELDNTELWVIGTWMGNHVGPPSADDEAEMATLKAKLAERAAARASQ